MPKTPNPVKLLTESTRNQRKTMRKTKGKTRAGPAKAVGENPSLDTASISPWELEKTQQLRERAIGLGGELAAFYGGPKTEVFIQSGRRMPCESVEGSIAQLLIFP